MQTCLAWGSEKYIGETGEKTLQYNAKALGSIDMLSQIIELLEGNNE